MPSDAPTLAAYPIVTVQIPAALAERLGGPGAALEVLALGAYQAGTLTAYELRLTLGLETRYELDGLLKAHGIYEPGTLEDIQQDVATLERLGF